MMCRDDVGETVAILLDSPFELELEPVLDFLSMGGGRVDVLDLLSPFNSVPLFVPAERGLVGVGVTELASSSPVLGEESASVGELGACETEEVGVS